MKKRILTFALVLAFVMAFLPLSASAAVSKYDGTKSTELRTENGKYYIDSAADLAYWAESVSAGTSAYADEEVILTTDIVWNEGDASTWAKKAPANKWVTAGGWGKPFKGIFDGQGHKISGLYMNADNGEDNLGFIGSIEGYVTIKNLVIDNSYFTYTCDKGNVNVGLVGVSRNAQLSFENVYMNAIVEGPGGSAALFLGRVHSEAAAQSISFKNCVAVGSVTIGKTRAGAFVGQNATDANNPEGSNDHVITFENCFANVNIMAKDWVGGLIGGEKNYNLVDMKNVVSVGTVGVTDGTNIGALSGLILKENRPDAKITATNAYYLKGVAATAFGPTINTAATAVTADQLKGDAAKTTLTGFDFSKTWTAVKDGYPLPTTVANMIGTTSPTNPTNPTNPGTSDLSVVLLVSVSAVAVLAAVAVVLKRKHA